MHIYRSVDEYPSAAPVAFATIGNFDGVHRGHQWVLEQIKSRAGAAGASSLVITFDPHPSRAIRPDLSCPLITPANAKLELLAETGVDAVLVIPFTETLARMSAEEFARDLIRRRLNVRELHEGENFRFGKDAAGDIAALSRMGDSLGFKVFSYSPLRLHGTAVSSSRIRSLISAGRVEDARRLLGRPFTIQSTPAKGRGYGTLYTVPTINLAPYPELLPANGVYVTRLSVGSGGSAQIFEAVTNVGNRPTFGEDSFTVESHLLNFQPLALTDETPLELSFLSYLRPEQRWPDPSALLAQIGRDVTKAKRYFSLCRAMVKTQTD